MVELIHSLCFWWSISYLNTLFTVSVVIKQQETEPLLALPTISDVNENVMEYWHSFHFELNTALPQVSRDDIKFCIWVTLGIPQAWVELYLVGTKPVKLHTCPGEGGQKLSSCQQTYWLQLLQRSGSHNLLCYSFWR